MQLIFLPRNLLHFSKYYASNFNHWFSFQRRLYEFALNAVCCPLRVNESQLSSEQLADHVAKVDNKILAEKKNKNIEFVLIYSYSMSIEMNI